MLGDSVLKLQLSLHFFVLNPNHNEGALTMSRIKYENNDALRNNANKLQIEEYMLCSSFDRKKYLPPCFNGNELQKISDKTVADVVEAAIGAVFLHSGNDGASDVIKFLLGDEDGFLPTWAAYNEKWMRYGEDIRLIDSVLLDSCATVSARIGYTFNNVGHLADALTHLSAITGGSSYERLEFLGIYTVNC
jgi:endoribonuclease Dicer